MTKKTNKIIALLLVLAMSLISVGAIAMASEVAPIKIDPSIATATPNPDTNLTPTDGPYQVPGSGAVTVVNNNRTNAASKYSLYRLLTYQVDLNSAPDYNAYEYVLTDLGRAFIDAHTDQGKNIFTAGGSENTGKPYSNNEAGLIAYLTALINADDAVAINTFGMDLWEVAKDRTADYSETIAAGESYTFADVVLGYYAVFDTTGQPNDAKIQGLVNLDNVNDDKTIYVKPSEPKVDKYIDTDKDTTEDVNGDGIDDDNVKWTDAEVGDDIYFKIYGEVPDYSGYDPDTVVYRIVDELSDAFDLPDGWNPVATPEGLKVTINGEQINLDSTGANGYKLTVVQGSPTKITIDLSGIIQNYPAGAQIVVEYYATLNENASVKDANQNSAKVEFTKPDGTVETDADKSTVDVYTYMFDFSKVKDGLKKQDSLTQNDILNRRFKLYKSDSTYTEQDIITFTKKGDVGHGETGYYYPDENGEEIIGFGWDVKVKGLDSGYYILVEEEKNAAENAEDGYTGKLTAYKFEIKVHRTDDGEVEYVELIPENGSVSWIAMTKYIKDDPTADDVNVLYIQVVNTKNTGDLPETGGIGTVIFTIIGLALMIGAASVVFTSTRRKRA